MAEKKREEVEYQILGKGPPSTEYNFYDVVELKMGDKVVIGQKAFKGQNPFFLVAGFKRSDIVESGPVRKVLVHRVLRDEEPEVRALVQSELKLTVLFMG